MQAVLALQWLSKMHAACWGALPSGIWPKVSVTLNLRFAAYIQYIEVL